MVAPKAKSKSVIKIALVLNYFISSRYVVSRIAIHVFEFEQWNYLLL